MNIKEKGLKRLSIDIPQETHSLIKICAAKRAIDMRTYVLRSLLRTLIEDNGPRAGEARGKGTIKE